jgi:cytochrome c-type biogenesis protein CcmE
MDPSSKRRVRLVVALSAAVLLAAALIYTSFSAATDTEQPSQLAATATPGRSYQLTGKVVPGSIARHRGELRFAMRDRGGRGPAVQVLYAGAVPDPFKEGREVIVSGQMRDGTFVGERDSLVTKCPSKFKNAPQGQRS